MFESVIAFARTPGGMELLFGILVVWPLWRVFARAGLPPWLALLVFVPVAGLVLVLAALALRPWPRAPRPE